MSATREANLLKPAAHVALAFVLGALAYPGTVLLAWLYMPRIERVGPYAGLGYLGWTGFVGIAASFLVLMFSITAFRRRTHNVLRRGAIAFILAHLINLLFVWVMALYGPPGTGQTL